MWNVILSLPKSVIQNVAAGMNETEQYCNGVSNGLSSVCETIELSNISTLKRRHQVIAIKMIKKDQRA
jgi:hypothetical protein